jgi:hypothetical protein
MIQSNCEEGKIPERSIPINSNIRSRSVELEEFLKISIINWEKL